jgi:hypothetical protein
MNGMPRYQLVGRGTATPDKHGDYCKYEDVEHWVGMYSLCNDREQALLAERDRLKEALYALTVAAKKEARAAKKEARYDDMVNRHFGVCIKQADAALQEAGDE